MLALFLLFESFSPAGIKYSTKRILCCFSVRSLCHFWGMPNKNSKCLEYSFFRKYCCSCGVAGGPRQVSFLPKKSKGSPSKANRVCKEQSEESNSFLKSWI